MELVINKTAGRIVLLNVVHDDEGTASNLAPGGGRICVSVTNSPSIFTLSASPSRSQLSPVHRR
ncbi:MAG: hypothetical protein K1X78_16570 [Verrucomicrobiaceae bacterium]|nr:hypothetical protein [Verrucomicrobiaceae bacterium]